MHTFFSPRGWLLAGLAVGVLIALVPGCVSKVDPNKNHFSCVTPDDCGSGYECKAQFRGGSLCFKKGDCSDVEQCNGKDDNCDGQIDETFPTQNMGCATGLKGVCAQGASACSDGGIVCVQMVSPTTETCNEQDDDCDGVIDNGFDKTQDPNNCGSCGNVCPSGTACIASACRETDCSDGIDNDGKNGADCEDPACAGQLCFIDATDAGWRCAVPDGGADAGDLDGGDAGDQDSGVDDAGAPDAGGTDAGDDDGGSDGGTDAGLFGCFPP